MINITNLRVDYPKHSMTFKDAIIKRNKVTFITGKNGTGKTTLLKSIASLIEFEGDIKRDGFVTYLSQEPVVFRMTVLENILYPLRIRNLDISQYQEKIETYAKYLDFSHMLEKDASKISSGEKMKVTIIRSIIFHPDYVLLDEPTTHLDVESIEALIKLIKELKNDITFMIVSHNQRFIEKLKEDEIRLGDNNV